MSVVVQFHRQVHDDLERWLAGREQDDDDRAMLVRFYLDELTRTLEDTAGRPPGAVRIGEGEP